MAAASFSATASLLPALWMAATVCPLTDTASSAVSVSSAHAGAMPTASAAASSSAAQFSLYFSLSFTCVSLF